MTRRLLIALLGLMLWGCSGRQPQPPQRPLSGAPTPGTAMATSTGGSPGALAAKHDPSTPPRYPVNLPPDYPTGK